MSNADIHNELITYKDYRQALVTSNSYFTFLLNQAYIVLKYVIQKICYYKDIAQLLKIHLKKYLDLNPINCVERNTATMFVNFFSKYFIFHWIKSINKILKGKDARLTKNMHASIKILAYKKYIKSTYLYYLFLCKKKCSANYLKSQLPQNIFIL